MQDTVGKQFPCGKDKNGVAYCCARCQIVKLKRSNFGSAYKNVECLPVNAIKFDVEILIYPTFAPIARD